MTEKNDAQKLLETWKEHFETEGFSPEQSERMAAVAAGPVVLREARGDEIDLSEAFSDYFERKGATPMVAKAMGRIASGELNPGPRVTGDRLIALVEG